MGASLDDPILSYPLKEFIYIDYQYIMQQPMKFAQTNQII